MESRSAQCRTCLAFVQDYRNIFKTVKVAGEPIRFADILERCFDYMVPEEDTLTQEICLRCVFQLTSTFSFKILINESLNKLGSPIDKIECKEEFDESQDYDDENPECDDVSEADIKEIILEHKGSVMKKVENNESVSNNKPLQIKNNDKKEIDKSKIPQVLYCVKCKLRFECSNDLHNHCTKKHKPEGKSGRQCNYCNEKFNDFKKLIVHRKYHFHPYLCQKCWIGFDTEYNVDNHTCLDRMVSRPRPRPSVKVVRQCHVCGKSYPTGYIKIHMMIHGEGTYKCKYCPKTFKVPCSLNSHVAWNHKKERNHKCNYCNATFITASAKSAHVRKHHLKEKNHTCETCGKQFFSKSEMQRHNVTHTGVRNFHCHHCDKSYQTRYGLTVHMKSHSQYTNL